MYPSANLGTGHAGRTAQQQGQKKPLGGPAQLHEPLLRQIQLLRGRMQQTLGLNEADARSAACAVLAQLPDALPQIMERLSREE